ncbi:MAG: acyltransferase family protein [Desulfobulbales bacterium]|nr:acyltransferase family protein [Desulfobulbales bacterium]
MDNSGSRDFRLDIAKASAISLVVIWHMRPLYFLQGKKLTIYAEVFRFLLEQFYFQISLLAVPMFVLVSLYLYFQKLNSQPLAYTLKRCRRIGAVFLFWSVVQIAFYFAVNFANKGNLLFWNDYPLYQLLMMGGPSLPYIGDMGDSVFYYLFVLLILVPFAYLFFTLKKFPKLFSSLGAIIVAVSLLYFEFTSLNGKTIPHWRIDNFIVYVPLSYFLLCARPGKINHYIPLYYMGYFVFSLQDVYLFFAKKYTLGLYSRVSIVFGAMAVLSSLLQLNGENKARAVSLLAKFSLGIYALHIYCLLITIVISRYFKFNIPFYITAFPLDFGQLILAICAISLTLVTVYLLSFTFLKKFIS